MSFSFLPTFKRSCLGLQFWKQDVLILQPQLGCLLKRDALQGSIVEKNSPVLQMICHNIKRRNWLAERGAHGAFVAGSSLCIRIAALATQI